MRRHFVLFLLLPLLLAAAPDPIWPEIDSDLPADPGVQLGCLPNGLRYALRRNAEPRDRVTLRLVVRAGSLQETDEETGLAHFLEHMVFRGTKRHPKGALTTELQRLGIGFGPDSTAFTLFDYTIYHLELPDTTEATLRQGLTVFREYAEDVTFDRALIERERGVVLSELNTRDTPSDRAGRASLAFLWPKSRQAARAPIGTERAIARFAREQFVAFYDAWYRPERMAVIVVGDLAPELAKRLVGEVFGSLRARGPARTETESAIPSEAAPPNVAIFSDPGLIGANCTLLHPAPDPRVRDTHDQRVQQLHRALAFAMFERRIDKISRAADHGYVSPQASASAALPGWSLASFSVSGTILNWKDFIIGLEREHRRAFVHGFTEAELESAKTAFATAYDESVRTSATRASPWLAAELVGSFVNGTVVATPLARQQDLADALAAATARECTQAFRAAWTTRPPHVFIATHPQFNVSRQTIAEAFNESRDEDVPAYVDPPKPEFAYTNFGPASPPVSERSVPDLDVQQAEFANGVRLNFKPTSFDADSVEIYVRIGDGRLSQPAAKPGLNLLAGMLVPQGGLGRHTFQELRDICAGHAAAVSFYVDSDAFAFNARCAPRDLLFCLQVITAHLTDSAYRAAAMREINASFGSMYSSLSAAPGGPISADAEHLLVGGDSRFGIPTPEELFQRTADDVRAWVEPQFKSAPIELSIVGDTHWTDAKSAVAQTLATLPRRVERQSASTTPALQLAKPTKPAYLYPTSEQLRQVALAWLCPVPDLADMHQERRCRLLTELVSERLRVRLREQLGVTYNCAATFVQHEGFSSVNYFMIYAEVSPAHAERAAKLIRKELAALRRRRFSDDEFNRVKTPFLRARQDDLRNNSYWGYTVLRDAQQRPQRLAAARDRSADTAAITRRDLEEIAKRYFDPKRMFELVAYPAPNRPQPPLPTFPSVKLR